LEEEVQERREEMEKQLQQQRDALHLEAVTLQSDKDAFNDEIKVCRLMWILKYHVQCLLVVLCIRMR
jgi:hypothetical protein